MHKETLDRVPNSLPTRGNIEIEIYGMEGIPEADLREHEALKQCKNKLNFLFVCLHYIHFCGFSAGRMTTAQGADSSDEEGGSTAKKAKTMQPEIPVPTSSASIPPLGAMPMAPMLASPFMGMNPMAHYLGQLPMPMMGGMPAPQMPLPGAVVASPQTPSKPLFPSTSTSSPSSSSSASKPAFAAYGYE